MEPGRALTKNTKQKPGSDCDNVDSDLLLHTGDLLLSGGQFNYKIYDLLGQGTFGQVVRCRKVDANPVEEGTSAGGVGHGDVAVKVVKNKPAYFNQALTEIRILKFVKERLIKGPDSVFVMMEDYFKHKNHLCLTFEILGPNLYELLKSNQFRGLPTSDVREYLQQILDGCTALAEEKIVHCDLKPENILIVSEQEKTKIKIIDLGSACFEGETVYTYIQSRFYRSPEVLLRLGYDCAIDIWSVGCIAAELFLGLPLFPGVSEHSQLGRIVDMFEVYPPDHMLRRGRATSKFFKPRKDGGLPSPTSKDSSSPTLGVKKVLLSSNARYSMKRAPRDTLFQFKTPEEFAKSMNLEVDKFKTYFRYARLDDIIMYYPMPQVNVAKEREDRIAFIDLLKGLLNIDHTERWTASQARSHPFLSSNAIPPDGFTPLADAALDKRRQDMCEQLKKLRIKSSSSRKVGKAEGKVRSVGAALAVTPATGGNGSSRPVKIRKNRRTDSFYEDSENGEGTSTSRLPSTHLTPPQKIPRMMMVSSDSSPSKSHKAMHSTSGATDDFSTGNYTSNSTAFLGTSLPSSSYYMTSSFPPPASNEETSGGAGGGGNIPFKSSATNVFSAGNFNSKGSGFLGSSLPSKSYLNSHMSSTASDMDTAGDGAAAVGASSPHDYVMPEQLRRAQLAVGEIHGKQGSGYSFGQGHSQPGVAAGTTNTSTIPHTSAWAPTGFNNIEHMGPQSWAGVPAPWLQPAIFTPPESTVAGEVDMSDDKKLPPRKRKPGNGKSLLSNLFAAPVPVQNAQNPSPQGFQFTPPANVFGHFGSAPATSQQYMVFGANTSANMGAAAPTGVNDEAMQHASPALSPLGEDDDWADDQFDLEMDNGSPAGKSTAGTRETSDSMTTAVNLPLPMARNAPRNDGQ
jgi:dual specificity protein kinase YAK1